MSTFVIIITIIFFGSVIFLDLLHYYRFVEQLSAPFEKIKRKRTSEITVEELYNCYKELPKGKFKLHKMSVRAWNKPELIPQSVESYMKIIFSILLTAVGFATSILLATLGFTNSNLEMKKDTSSWISTLNYILQELREGMDLYKLLLFIALCVFITSFAHIYISYSKSTLHKKHMVVIEEIEKEYVQK